MYRYPYADDPEPKPRPETREDRLIRHGRKIFHILLAIAAAFFAVLLIYGIIMRLQTGKLG